MECDAVVQSSFAVLFLSFISAGQAECEAARCLEGALPVQVFILMHPSGVRRVSSEEQWKNAKWTFIPGGKTACLCVREKRRKSRRRKEQNVEKRVRVRDKWREEVVSEVGGRWCIRRWRTSHGKIKTKKNMTWKVKANRVQCLTFFTIKHIHLSHTKPFISFINVSSLSTSLDLCVYTRQREVK